MGGTRDGRRRPGRRLLAKFVSADSYGLVLVLVVLTYVVSVSSVAGWAQSVVLAIQIATVWLTFGPRGLRCRVVSWRPWCSWPSPRWRSSTCSSCSPRRLWLWPLWCAHCCISRRRLRLSGISRPGGASTRETVLGAIADYLFVGMFFAFTYRAIGILQPTPFFGAAGPCLLYTSPSPLDGLLPR